MTFDQESYHDFVLKYRSPDGKDVVGFFPDKRTLVSGRESFWYWNGRILLDYKEPMDTLAHHILNYCDEHGITPDYFVNVPEGVNKLTDYLNAMIGGKQVQMRAKPKTHGDPRDANFLGPVIQGDRVVLLEDVTTTGGSLIGVLEKLYESELNILGTLCECNRMELAARGRGAEREDFDIGVNEYVTSIRDKGTQHHALTDATKILPVAFKLWTPPEGVRKADIAQGLYEEYQDHGIVDIDLRKTGQSLPS
ncbi:MAG: hypothetical protein ABIH52_03405 [Candidatus Aenigmatarchaeota archaeon]